MMNDIFNAKRFFMLFKKYTLEHAKTNILSVCVCSGLLFLLLAYYAYDAKGHLGEPAQSAAFMVLMVLVGSIYTSLVFIEIGDKRKSIPVLTLPASHFEKFLVAWLYTYIFFQLIFLAIFYLIAEIVIHLGANPSSTGNQLINVFSINNKAFMAFPVFALLHAFNICGAIFFEKLHFIKTGFMFVVVVVLLIVFNNQLLNFIISNKMESVPFQGMGFTDNNHLWQIYPDKSVTQYGWYILMLIVSLLWLSSFFRLKEKEV